MKKVIFIIIILAISATLTWYFVLRIDKAKALKIIVKAKPGRLESSYAPFEEDFLIAWARAIRRGSPDFTHNGKNYSTETAKAK
jgi:hypothetical protein